MRSGRWSAPTMDDVRPDPGRVWTEWRQGLAAVPAAIEPEQQSIQSKQSELTDTLPSHRCGYPGMRSRRTAASGVSLGGSIRSGSAHQISDSTLRMTSSAISRSMPT